MVFIAVHIGAGHHLAKKRPLYSSVCDSACTQAIKALNNGSPAAEAIVVAIKHLENSELTNAGYGSNLNIAGYVECDASIMTGDDLLFGSVGAVQNIKNPIEVAYDVLLNQRKATKCGLIPPNMVVGEGAQKWAFSIDCTEANLKTERSTFKHSKYLELYNRPDPSENNKRLRLDTVGAICLDSYGVVAAGVSSGGLQLKKEGRVGQAAIFGAGCWAQDKVAVSTSGIGEYIIRTSLAKECATAISDSEDVVHSLVKLFDDSFFGSPLMKNVERENHLAGLVGLLHDPDSKSFELFWAHSTSTMCIGYMQTSKSSSAHSFISELSSSSLPGTTVTVQSKLFRYN